MIEAGVSPSASINNLNMDGALSIVRATGSEPKLLNVDFVVRNGGTLNAEDERFAGRSSSFQARSAGNLTGSRFAHTQVLPDAVLAGYQRQHVRRGELQSLRGRGDDHHRRAVGSSDRVRREGVKS